MTDNPSPPRAVVDVTVSDNVRAELARADMTALAMRAALAKRGVSIAKSTWDARMADPNTWRLGELQAIAEVLGIEPGELVR